jgi:hypothetical protein
MDKKVYCKNCTNNNTGMILCNPKNKFTGKESYIFSLLKSASNMNGNGGCKYYHRLFWKFWVR